MFRVGRLLRGAASRMAAPMPALRRRLATAAEEPAAKKDWWKRPEFWGFCGATAGWGMSGAAIYDSQFQGPEVISLKMTPVMIVYSSLFCRWALVVQPQNLLLAGCHATNVVAQTFQLYRAINHKVESGEGEAVRELGTKVGVGGAALAALIAGSSRLQATLAGSNIGPLSKMAAAPAGPFTVHFWAPASKWLISGASFLDLNRPTDTVSLAQYSALTLTGFFFVPYALLVSPINYMLASVNLALFGSSAWHLGRKINADFLSGSPPSVSWSPSLGPPLVACAPTCLGGRASHGAVCTQAPKIIGKADQLILADGVPLSRWVALVDADRDGEITEVNTTARQDCSHVFVFTPLCCRPRSSSSSPTPTRTTTASWMRKSWSARCSGSSPPTIGRRQGR